MKELSIDLETYSDVDISKCGVYKYAESDNFEILLFGVSVDNAPVTVYDLTAGDVIPPEILAALSDDIVTKWAFNASFERICLSNWLHKHPPQYFQSYNNTDDPVHNYLNPISWKCTMIWSAYMGLPLSLEGAGMVLRLQDFPNMHLTNRNYSKHTMAGMWRWNYPSNRNYQSFLSLILSGLNIISTRKSMTGGFYWIWMWWRMPLHLMKNPNLH